MADKPDGERSQQSSPGLRPRLDGQPTAFQRRLAAGEFAVTAEIGPPRGADTAPVARKAALLRGWVDAVNITDNQSAAVRLSSLAGSLAALAVGVEPIMQLTCRDRNRIALQSELLSASALGVPNVVIMTGDHPRHGDHSDATPVFDLNSTQLLRVATDMRDRGRLMSGGELKPPPAWFLGAVENPPGPRRRSDADAADAVDRATYRLASKIEAGAQFVQTQFVFDVPAFAAWMTRIRDLGLHERCHILAGVGPVRSQRALAHLATIPGVVIPDHVVDRLAGASPERFRAEGEKLCAEIIAGLAEMPGVAGVHVMAIGAESSIPAILQQAGVPARCRGRRARILLVGEGRVGAVRAWARGLPAPLTPRTVASGLRPAQTAIGLTSISTGRQAAARCPLPGFPFVVGTTRRDQEDVMMRYMLLMCGEVEAAEPGAPPEPTPVAAADEPDEPCWMPWAREMEARGVILHDGAQLQPVSHRDDGPDKRRRGPGGGRAVRRDQGSNPRLRRHRVRRPGRGHLRGVAPSGRARNGGVVEVRPILAW